MGCETVALSSSCPWAAALPLTLFRSAPAPSLLVYSVVGCCVIAGGLLLWLGRRQRQRSGLPAGAVLYNDTGGAWQAVQRPLRSRRYGLVGRPDYLVQTREAGRSFVVPVEIKSRARPVQPYTGHILQLAAYCLLVEENFEVAPPYGLLRYADATLRIPYTDELRRRALETAAEIRQARGAPNVRRNHNKPARCAACGYRSACGSDVLAAAGH